MKCKHICALLLLLPLTGGYLLILFMGLTLLVSSLDGLRGNEPMLVIAALVFPGYGLLSLWKILMDLPSKVIKSLSPFIMLGLVSGLLSLAVANYFLTAEPFIFDSFNLRMVILLTLNAGPLLILILFIKSYSQRTTS